MARKLVWSMHDNLLQILFTDTASTNKMYFLGKSMDSFN